MPLVAHSDLPAFARLKAEGLEVLSAARAARQDIRELHIGLLNLMPDAALEATERQFLRLVGGCNRIAQIYVHPFGVRGQERGPRARAHMAAHYREFEALREEGLDALLITGANPADPDLARESFWPGMVEVMEWGRSEVCSMVCSCLATHAALKVYHGIERIRLPRKRWGVYSHRLVERGHPLLAHIDTRFDAPHSHVYEVTGGQMRESGGHVLAESAEAGVHLAVSEDGLRFVYFQGHPEYDFNSLLKEHKREVARFARGERDDFPPFPEHYYGEEAQARLAPFVDRARAARAAGAEVPELPEPALTPLVDNTWGDTGKALFNNWLGLVYQITHLDRRVPFMDGVDPDDPLGWRGRLRVATPADVGDVRACVRAAYGRYVARMGKEPGPMLADFEAQAAAGQVSVVEVAGQLVGLIVMSREADHLFIENVAVWPAHQGRGHGRRLLRHAEREARRLGLEEIRLYTEVRMTENLALYPAIGYEEFDRRVEAGYRRVYFRKRVG